MPKARVDNLFRPGQWVKTARAMTLGKDHEKSGTVGIFRGPAMKAVPDTDEKGNPITRMEVIPDLYEVHLVDVPEGTTRKVVALKGDDLAAVTSRKDIPAQRLKTYDPKWEPIP